MTVTVAAPVATPVIVRSLPDIEAESTGGAEDVAVYASLPASGSRKNGETSTVAVWPAVMTWSGLAGGVDVVVRGSLGDDPHVKSSIVGALAIPLAWRFSLGAQAGMAGVWGEPAEQDLWQIATNGNWIRGHRNAVPTSRTWMGRVDLQRSIGFARLSVYGDWASAKAADYCAVGAGLVLMEGLVRFDVARGVGCGREGRSEAGWRFHPRSFTFF